MKLKWLKAFQTTFSSGVKEHIYHEGNISKMPDVDVFSLLDIRKRNRKSRRERKMAFFLL